MGKISISKIVIQLKIIFLEKGSIAWKLPLVLFILGNFNTEFHELFIRVMISFTMAKKEPTILDSKVHTEAYTEVFRQSFDSYGIDDIIYEIFALLVVLLFATILDRLKSEDMGTKINIKSVFLALAGVAASFIAVSVVTLALYLNGNLQFLGLTWKLPNSIKNLPQLIIFQGVLFFIVAIQEEIFCRAYLLNNLKYFRKWFSILYASLVFAVLHLSNIEYFAMSKFIGIANIFILGILFCAYFQKFKDLWFLIGAHFGWNFFMGSFYGMTISDVEKLKGRSILKVRLRGEEYFTGEGFGPEGSLFTTALFVVILIISTGIYIYKRRGSRLEKMDKENSVLIS